MSTKTHIPNQPVFSYNWSINQTTPTRFRTSAAFLLTLLFAGGDALAQQAPVISAVSNAASYSRGAVSPGEMVVLFGTLLGPSQLTHLQLDSNGKLSTTLGNTQVYFGGVAAPLIYVSATQLCAMVPYDVAGSVSTQVVVHYEGLVSQPYTVAVAPSAPGIFSANASGQGPAAASNANGSTNSATNPAAPGSYVTFYLTGEGQLAVPGSDGAIATAADAVGSAVTVTIGGVQAQVMYAGAAPGNTNGFAQVNAVIPSSLQSGGNLALTVQVGNAASQSGLTISVTGTAPPVTLAAPTNLQAVLATSTTANLTWVNNAPTATAIRVEVSAAGGAFQDVGAANALTSTTLGNLQPSTTYTLRVRAQSGQTYSAYSNDASITTPPQQQTRRTVLLLHGLRQSSTDIQPFAESLQTYLNPTLLTVNANFNYGNGYGGLPGGCTNNTTCPSTCTVENGARALAAFIQQLPAGHIEIVGYSLGGLIARDLILNNYSGTLSRNPVDALVTLGTPNLGYPYEPIDDTISCPTLNKEIDGNYRDTRGYVWTNYLSNLNQQWVAKALPTGTLPWLAVAGTACPDPYRLTGPTVFDLKPDTSSGCRNANTLNDNIVCEDSALFNTSSVGIQGLNGITLQLTSSRYSHTTGNWFDNLFVVSSFDQCNWTNPNTGDLGNPGADLLPSIASFLASH